MILCNELVHNVMNWSGLSICDITLFVYFAVHVVYILFLFFYFLFFILYGAVIYIEMAPNKYSMYVWILLFLFISALFVMNLWFDIIKYIDMYVWGGTKRRSLNKNWFLRIDSSENFSIVCIAVIFLFRQQSGGTRVRVYPTCHQIQNMTRVKVAWFGLIM